jgi:AhpD family alkylhydroperoxidase
MPTDLFVDHTLESAPPGSRRLMEGTVRHLCHLPPAVARLATSPQTLEGFLKASALFETTGLTPVAREVLIMTVAARNGCDVCIEMHSARLKGLGAAPELIAALRESRSLDEPELEAIRLFTLAVVATSGAVDNATLEDFLSHGYTAANALEVVLGIGTYTMSTLANRMTGAGLT